LRCGAHHAVLSDGWLAAVRDLTGERAVDIVLDPVGGDRMTDSLRSLAPEGRLVVRGIYRAARSLSSR
jgi:NADPH2:quinone reductase